MLDEKGQLPAGKILSSGLTLFEILKRIDFYISMTNNKSMLLIAYNIFSFGVVVLNWSTLIPLGTKVAVAIFLVISCLANITSFLFTLLAVFPDLRVPSSSSSNSLIFFADIAKLSEGAYTEQLKGYDEEKQKSDLALQIHAVAKAATSKLRKLSVAVIASIVHLTSVLVVLAIKVFSSL